MSSDREKTCNCKKSNCLKLYCECFASGAYCVAQRCNCLSCQNNFEFEDQRRVAVLATLERNPNAFRSKIIAQDEKKVRHQKGCHCKKSNCLKKYCECFQGKIFCSDLCRCKDCYNHPSNLSDSTPIPRVSAMLGAGQYSDGETPTASSSAYRGSLGFGVDKPHDETLTLIASSLTPEVVQNMCTTLVQSALSSGVNSPRANNNNATNINHNNNNNSPTDNNSNGGVFLFQSLPSTNGSELVEIESVSNEESKIAESSVPLKKRKTYEQSTATASGGDNPDQAVHNILETFGKSIVEIVKKQKQ